MSRVLKALQQLNTGQPTTAPSETTRSEDIRRSDDMAATLASAERAATAAASTRIDPPTEVRSTVAASAAGPADAVAASAAASVVSGSTAAAVANASLDDAGGVRITPLTDRRGSRSSGVKKKESPEEMLRSALGRRSTRVAQGPYVDLARTMLSQLTTAQPAAVLLASPDGDVGQGKSLLSLAEALLQQADGDVLLLGCDGRNPSAADRYGIQARWGLVDLLSGTARWPKVVEKIGRPPLSVVLGRGLQSEGELPTDFSWQTLITQFRQRFRLVVLDATTLAMEEAAEIARHCEGTYLVIQADRTSRSLAKRATRTMNQADARLLGCILLTP